MGVPAATMAGLNMLSTAAGIYQRNVAAEQAAKSSNEAFMANQRQLQNEQMSINQNTALQLTENEREAMRRRSQAMVAQAESGVAGNSPLQQLSNIYLQKALTDGSTMAQGKAALSQTGAQAQSMYRDTQSALNQAKSQTTSGVFTGLQILSSGVNGYYTGKAMSAK